MSKPVVTTAQAELQILEIDAWWRENREKAPDKFEEELAAGIRTIATLPRAGKRYPHPRVDVRRMSLRSTRQHVYYVERDEWVVIVAVWGSAKKSGPDLSGL